MENKHLFQTTLFRLSPICLEKSTGGVRKVGYPGASLVYGTNNLQEVGHLATHPERHWCDGALWTALA